MTSDDPLMLEGQVLDGTYRIDKMVGEGGFGVVYRAFHLGFQQPVAVKCLKIPPVRPDVREAFLAKFREESSILFRLSMGTFGIVRSIAVGATTTPSGVWAPYFVLEWLEGESLEQVMEKRRMQGFRGRSLVDAAQWFDGPARALAYAHRERVAHRDIKPANLFVLRDSQGKAGAVPTIKLLDFGIAKAMGQNQSGSGHGLTTLGYSAFSPKYSAPEQVDPRLGLTGPWSDVYSFALVLVEFLTDRCAIESDEQLSLMLEVVNPSVRPTPRTKGLIVEQCIEDVFARALHVNPTHRFQDMEAFWYAFVSAVQADSVRVSAGPTSGTVVAAVPGSVVSMERSNSVSAVSSTRASGTEIAQQSGVYGYGSTELPHPVVLSVPVSPSAGIPNAESGGPRHPNWGPVSGSAIGNAEMSAVSTEPLAKLKRVLSNDRTFHLTVRT